MFHDPAPDRYTDLFDTPHGRAHNELIYAQRDAATRDRNTKPSATSAAHAKFRQQRFIDPGLEGPDGAGSVYHLEYVCSGVLSTAEMLDPDSHRLMTPHKSRRIRIILKNLGYLHGYRYMVGVRGVVDALQDARVPPAMLGAFMLERDAFAEDFLPRLDAAFMVNEKSENPNAAVTCIRLFVDEMLRVCEWTDETAEHFNARGMRTDLAKALNAVSRWEHAAETPTRRKRRGH